MQLCSNGPVYIRSVTTDSSHSREATLLQPRTAVHFMHGRMGEVTKSVAAVLLLAAIASGRPFDAGRDRSPARTQTSSPYQRVSRPGYQLVPHAKPQGDG